MGYINVVFVSNFFKKKKTQLVAVDLSHNRLKALVVETETSNLVIKGLVNEVIVPSSIMDNESQNLATSAQCIEKAFRRAKITAKDVALAIPAKDVVTQIVEMGETKNPSQLFTEVYQYLKQHFPYVQEMNFDFQVLPSKRKGFIDVHIVACKKHKIDRLKALMASVKLNLVIVDVKSYALERAYLYKVKNVAQAEGRVALIEYSPHVIYLHILHKGKTEYVREHQQADNPFSPEEMAKQLARALHHYYSSKDESPLEKIYLMSAIKLLPDIKQFLEEVLKLSVELIQPLKDIPTNLANETLPEETNWMTCLGLALRGCQNDHTY